MQGKKRNSGLKNAPDENFSFIRKIILSGAFRFAGWWSIFAGVLALNSVCPVCGSAACPVGIGTTGVIAVFFEAIRQWGGRILRVPFDHIRSIRGKIENNIQP